MEEFFRFIQQSGRGRDRLVQEARAIDDSVFPQPAPIGEQSNKAPIGHTASGVNAFRDDGIFS
jgi:hypothetical protein